MIPAPEQTAPYTAPTPDIVAEHLHCYDLDFYTTSLTLDQGVAQVIFLHGYGDHHRRYDALRYHLAQQGISSYGIDLRGQGRTTGPRGFTEKWHYYIDDLEILLCSGAVPKGLPTFIIAHSHGALVAIHAALAGKLDWQVSGLVLTAPFLRQAFTVPKWKRLLARAADTCLPELRIASGIGVIPMTRDPEMEAETRDDPLIARCATPRWYVSMLQAQRWAMLHAGKVTNPLLMLLGTADGVADPGAMREFFDAAGSKDKTKLEYPGLHHELLREVEREAIYQDISRWILARIGPSPNSVTHISIPG